jgi:hypothetical protein
MVATIARATGYDRVRAKEVHRLGSEAARATAATWRTFATAEVRANGRGWVEVKRDGVLIHVFEFGPEDEA